MPAGPGHPHPENLPRVEVPQPLPAAEEQPDSGGSVVPSLRGEVLHSRDCGSLPSAGNYEGGLETRSIVSHFVFFRPLSPCSNKRNTRRSSAPRPWCSPTPEDGR